ncbi:MAG TPA: 2-phosphosulfolactate phosphatase [Bacteroidia bacterium]|jgi:2-phosphosulfolactate phosphatase|nr:2-phosphosulfolactate phosphatase [Bacteroidia bacterium]
MKNTIEVCFTPHSFPLFPHEERLVVVIDVLRATSCMCAAFHHGIGKILPVASIAEARDFQSKGFLVAAERQAQKVEGFDLGNSPFEYMKPELKGKVIVFTTTNGTQAIRAAKDAYKIAIGSFLNLSALCEWLTTQHKNIILLCAGWKDFFNLEDTLCSGAIACKLDETGLFEINYDSTLAAKYLYEKASTDIYAFMENSSHFKRLSKLNLYEDMRYCLTPDTAPVVPIMEGHYLVPNGHK